MIAARGLAIVASGAILAWQSPAGAEPHFAVQLGYKCVACHVSPTGGGMRNSFGNTFAQNVLPARTLDLGEAAWTGEIGRYFAVGGNLRAAWTATDLPNQSGTNEFDVSEGRIYLLAQPVPGRLLVYFDERVAPGSASSLEALVRYWWTGDSWYLQAGRMYLPFGLRLEDDSSFTRRVGGINMTTPDDGVAIGWESASWSMQAALSNGSGGGPESDSDKQLTGQLAYVDARWRLGLSANYNAADAGDRGALGVMGGLRTGPVAWLGEALLVQDDGYPEGRRTMAAALLEADWHMARGHNLKLVAEWSEPDRDVDEDEQSRFSLVYEYAPVQFLQLRAGARFSEGIPQNDQQNSRYYFIELHGFF